MTSKEKLDYICNTTQYIDQDIEQAEQFKKDIEKELKLLEIFKRFFNLEEGVWYDLDREFKNSLYIDSCISLSKDEIELLKELENDR